MQLEDYFEFETDPVERIRIRGTRIDIDYVISLHAQGMTAEQIAVYFVRPLTPEVVYATITYYLQNKAKVDAYIERGRVLGQLRDEEYERQAPSAAAKRLRDLKATRAARI